MLGGELLATYRFLAVQSKASAVGFPTKPFGINSVLFSPVSRIRKTESYNENENIDKQILVLFCHVTIVN